MKASIRIEIEGCRVDQEIDLPDEYMPRGVMASPDSRALVLSLEPAIHAILGNLATKGVIKHISPAQYYAGR